MHPDREVKAELTRSVPCFGFVVQEAAAADSIDPKQMIPLIERNTDALKAAGIAKPISLLNRLQRTREPITLPDGAVLEPPPLTKPGRKLVILGDTFDASDARSLAMDADLVVHEATNAHTPEDSRFSSPDETLSSLTARTASHGHSTPQVCLATWRCCRRLTSARLPARSLARSTLVRSC